MATNEVYMHGQILGTHSFLLKGGFLEPDEYSEIKKSIFYPEVRQEQQQQCFPRWEFK